MKEFSESLGKTKNRLESDLASQVPSVIEAIESGRPLDAEEDTERKLAYIQQNVGVNRDIAERIANYESPETLPIDPLKKKQAESLQGETMDFLPVSFIDMARAASRSVMRITYLDRTPLGTGFLISPKLVLTNNHVLSNIIEARQACIEFDYEDDGQSKQKPVTRFKLDPDRLFLTDPKDDLDFALIAVGDRLDGGFSLADFGFLPLLNTPDKHIKGIFVNVIQHPGGDPKQIVLRENRILARTMTTLIYGTDTLRGSSGSPVFNDDWEVVALHHWGTPYRAIVDNPPDKLPDDGNEGVRISSIIDHLDNELNNLENEKAELLREALNPAFRQPSLAVEKKIAEYSAPNEINREEITSREEMRKTEIMSKSNENQANDAKIVKDETVTWTIPLVVSVRLDLNEVAQSGAAATKTPVETEREDFAEAASKFIPDSDYNNRKGYNPNFLGVKVSLPKLNDAQKQIVARLKSDTSKYELKYNHFSVVINGSRRLPFFTAVNIDGASVVNIDRETEVVKRVEKESLDDGAEKYEKWYDDERIEANQRSDQKLYSHADLKGFHRGHLVKRTDPSWGTVEKAFKGQADTFHFTNCAPQHSKFNPSKSRWLGVEDWITKSSDDEDLRVTVFSGCVFRDDDPHKSYIQVPREFWKVIVRVEDGELLATGIVADQSDLIGAQEGLAPMPDKLPAEYQQSIEDIENLTGLTFGNLREHDTFAGGSEGTESKRRINSFEDIQISKKR